jgi:predicted DNA-binding transcriptional regulator AlpA
MSSNIRIKRVCAQCHQDFVARTTVTKFCSLDCNRRYYKTVSKSEKINQSELETTKFKQTIRLMEVEKDFLSVAETAVMLGCSKAAIYKMIKFQRLKSVNFLENMIRIRRQDIFEKFDAPSSIPINVVTKIKAVPLPDTRKKQNRADFYGIDELMLLFDKSRTAIYTAFARAGVSKIKIGKEVYFEKKASDKLLKKYQAPKQSDLERERLNNQKLSEQGLKASQCYSIDECVKMFGKDRSLLYGIFNRRLVPKIREGHNVLLSKKVIDRLYKTFKKEGKI